MKVFTPSVLALSLLAMGSAHAFELKSNDIQEGHPMAKTFEYNSWGCDGGNQSPQLTWSDVPEGTKSFAITAYDPDAPTGSGFWHWVAFNIPASVTELPRGVDIKKLGAKSLESIMVVLDLVVLAHRRPMVCIVTNLPSGRCQQRSSILIRTHHLRLSALRLIIWR